MGLIQRAIVLIGISLFFSPSLSSATTIQELSNWAQSTKSVDEFVSRLSEELRSSYTLLYLSRSAQGGTFQAPRALLFDPKDAHIVLGFTEKLQRGGDAVEIILFDKETNNFRFHSVEFDYEEKRPGHLVLDSNMCNGCHAGRPNWDSHNVWPGAYGSFDDEVFKRQKDAKQKFTDAISEKEHSELEKFLADAPNKDRYRHLLPLVHEAPNSQLGALLSKYNFKRLTASFTEESVVPVVQSLLDCDVGQKTDERMTLIEDGKRRERDATKLRMNFRVEYSEVAMPPVPEPQVRDTKPSDIALANLRMLVKAPAIPMRNWSMEVHRRPYYGFENGEAGLLDWTPVLAEHYPAVFKRVSEECRKP